MQNATDAERFWTWSLAVYGQPGFSAAALELQDTHGLDVNLVLYALWAGVAEGLRLAAPELAAARTAVAHWQSRVVVPLRTLRRELKSATLPGAGAIREQVAAAELAAERVEQALLTAEPRGLRGGPPGPALAAANLVLYAGAAGLAPTNAALLTVLALASGIGPADASACLARAAAG